MEHVPLEGLPSQ